MARASISVEDHDRDEPWSFRNHVEPVLTKQGCNSGACHGAAAGKNGFRLTLRGYAPEIDHAVLTRQALGRRVVKTAPQESLMLLKPTGAIEHGGGVRFTTGSLEYRVIAEWIAAGMPGPVGDAIPEIRALTVYPAAVRLEPGQVQQVLVQATYSDGRVEDVTHWAKFSQHRRRGRLGGRRRPAQGHRPGRGVRLGLVRQPGRPRHGDVAVRDEARSQGLRLGAAATTRSTRRTSPSSPRCGSRRRRMPATPRSSAAPTSTRPARCRPLEQVEAFLEGSRPGSSAPGWSTGCSRAPNIVDYWAYKWSDLLLVSSRKLPAPSMWSFYRFVRQSVAKNVPWDRFARSIVTAQGSTLVQRRRQRSTCCTATRST